MGAKNPAPVCRVKVSQDVPTRQPKTKLEVSGTPHLSSKLMKTMFLFFTLDSTKRFEGPWVYLQGREMEYSQSAIAWRGGPTVWLQFSVCQLSPY